MATHRAPRGPLLGALGVLFFRGLATMKTFRNEHGQLAIVVPLTLAMAVGGTMLWGYQRAAHTQYAASRSSMSLDTLGKRVAGRVKYMLETGQSTSLSASCTAFQSAFIQPVRAFPVSLPTGLPVTTVSPYVFDSVAGTVVAPDDCFLMKGEDKEFYLKDFKVQVIESRPPDILSLTTELILKVDMSASVPGSAMIRGKQYSKRLLLSVGRLSNYALILNGTSLSEGSPAIKFSSGSGSASILGQALVTGGLSGDPSPVSFDSIANTIATGGQDPQIALQKPVLVRATQLAPPDSATLPRDMSGLKVVFRNGIRTGVFSKDRIEALPFSDTMLSSEVWDQVYSYRDINPLAIIQNSHAAATVGTLTLDTLDSSMKSILSPTMYDTGMSKWTIPPADISATFSTKIPDGSDKGITKLSDTCTPGNPPRVFVHQRSKSSGFNVSFDSTTIHTLCGLIFVGGTVTVTGCPANTTCTIIGMVIADRIEFSGAGSYILANPYDPATVVGLELPPGQSVAGLRTIFQQTASSLGFNFHVPIFKKIQTGTDFGRFRPLDIRNYMQRCTVGTTAYACPRDTITPPDNASLFTPSSGSYSGEHLAWMIDELN